MMIIECFPLHHNFVAQGEFLCPLVGKVLGDFVYKIVELVESDHSKFLVHFAVATEGFTFASDL